MPALQCRAFLGVGGLGTAFGLHCKRHQAQAPFQWAAPLYPLFMPSQPHIIFEALSGIECRWGLIRDRGAWQRVLRVVACGCHMLRHAPGCVAASAVWFFGGAAPLRAARLPPLPHLASAQTMAVERRLRQ